ncbi:MAG: aquaporin [Thiomargarita sp.]|nr:aquaporin [Bacteroidales bacterium]MCK5718373.1 aquaporin [Thiomargarita sp.]
MKYLSEFVGEFIGTFIIVFFGCGSVAVTILFSAHSGLFQIAIIWGISISLAIYATRHLSCAHLNPAVSIAMVIGKRMSIRRLPTYLVAQFSGAFIAASVLYIIFSPSIAQYEELNHITRGSLDSIKTAMIFGEYYPNPTAGSNVSVSMTTAFLAESFGTFILVFLIFSLTEGCNTGRPDTSLTPILIGLTVTIIISIIAPLTQAGLNPARDFSPRMFSMLAGWGEAALPDEKAGFFIVYIVGPISGGILSSLIFTRVIEPIMKTRDGNHC